MKVFRWFASVAPPQTVFAGIWSIKTVTMELYMYRTSMKRGGREGEDLARWGGEGPHRREPVGRVSLSVTSK